MEEKEEADDPEHANVDNMLTQGEFVYELYAVLVHTGGAFGGHYFAYIKNISDGLWYNFNDSHVTPLTDE
jgi:ubiquitin carboxyl-terminal hydrolase 47